MFQIKVVGKMETYILCSITFFSFENCAVNEIMEEKYRVIRNDCWGFNNCHLVLQMQPHVISFCGVTSSIRFMFLLFPQVSRN